MQTKLISAKLDRINSGLLVIFALDTAEKKQTQPVIKLLTGGGSLTKATAAILSGGEFAAGSCANFVSRFLRGSIPLQPPERWSKGHISAISIPIPIVQTAKTRVSSNSVCLGAAGRSRLPSRLVCEKA